METESDFRKKELMAEVIKRAGHQAAQIESILVCARGTAQPIVLNKTEINPEEIVQAAIDDICVELKAKPHSIEVINEAPGLTCPADRGYLENVMKNLIENALKEAKEKLKSWNMEREDSILNNWIFQTAFFSKKYVKQDFIYNESDPASTQDFYSVFDQQWRTTVNKVDLDNPVELSNGVAYKITSLKIPTNKILIWRIKERFETFDQLTDEDKKYYYPGYNYISTYLKDIGENVQMNRVKQYVGANQPKPWLPAVYCKSMMLWVVDTDRPGIFKFKCYRLVEDKASTTGFTAVPYKIPAGPYNFYMGFNGSRSQVNATFYLNGKKIPKCESGPIPSSTMKGSNHDRSGGGYSELYKDSRYDRDGSTDLGVVIFDKTEELEVTIEFTKGAKSDMEPTTWCFRPTVDLY